MKNFIVLFVLLFLNTALYAQEMTCLDKLMPYNRNSGLHMLTKDEWSEGKEALNPEISKLALNFLVNSKLLCKSGEIVIKVFPVCSLVVPDLPQSNTCFIFTNVGYFVLSRDNGKNINFIFSKDKKFSE